MAANPWACGLFARGKPPAAPAASGIARGKVECKAKREHFTVAWGSLVRRVSSPAARRKVEAAP